MTQHFGPQYSSSAPENYERFFVPAIGAPMARDLIGHARLQPGERVLDVACGTGIVARLAADETGPRGKVAGLDINPGMLSVARKVSPAHIQWHESGAEEMPLDDNTFDVVLCQISLQFMPDRLKALEEMHRVLVPGGRVIVTTPGPASPVWKALADTLDEYSQHEAAGFIRLVFSMHNASEMKQLLSGAGFSDVSVTEGEKTFRLPAPRDFFRQYVSSTPLAAMLSRGGGEMPAGLEDSVVSRWSTYQENQALVDALNILQTTARR